jgi:hypothetical protein
MAECWAKSVGQCSEKMTLEHLVSDGMYPDEVLVVQGLHWCKHESKEVPIKVLSSRILCDNHNKALSPVDKAGIDAMRKLREASALHRARVATGKDQRWTNETFTIDGRGLERWCLKTLINVAFGDRYKIGKDSEQAGKPSSRLVRIAFGQEQFKPKAGLYGVACLGANWTLVEGFRLIFYVDTEQVLVGSLFSMHGYQFMLHLEESGLGVNFSIPDLYRGTGYIHAQTMYPPEAIKFQIGKRFSHILKFTYV